MQAQHIPADLQADALYAENKARDAAAQGRPEAARYHAKEAVRLYRKLGMISKLEGVLDFVADMEGA